MSAPCEREMSRPQHGLPGSLRVKAVTGYSAGGGARQWGVSSELEPAERGRWPHGIWELRLEGASAERGRGGPAGSRFGKRWKSHLGREAQLAMMCFTNAAKKGRESGRG